MLICMAHVKSLPERAAICDERAINLLALEHVTEPPPRGEAYVRSRLAMQRILEADGRPARTLAVTFAGFSEDMFGALQHAARSHPRSLDVLAAARGRSRAGADGDGRCSSSSARWRRPRR